MKTAIDKFWSTFGHLDIDPDEKLDADDVISTGNFTDDDIEQLITAGLVFSGSQKFCRPTPQ
jgi:hypothetical protein